MTMTTTNSFTRCLIAARAGPQKLSSRLVDGRAFGVGRGDGWKGRECGEWCTVLRWAHVTVLEGEGWKGRRE
jgi:hypothetical protein